MLDDIQYQQYVTGYPPGVVRQVAHPTTGEAFEFAQDSDGTLLFTCATLANATGPDGELTREAEQVLLDFAATQLRVVDGRALIQWVCQRPEDARQIRELFQGGGQIPPPVEVFDGRIEVVNVIPR